MLHSKAFEEIKLVRTKNGATVPFAGEKIVNTVQKVLAVSGEGGKLEAEVLAQEVFKGILELKTASNDQNFMPSVEAIQDLIESALKKQIFVQPARVYSIFNEHKDHLYREFGIIPDHVRKLAEESKKYFRNSLGEFVYYRTYARWIEQEQRRETWKETVNRYVSFMRENLGDKLTDDEYKETHTMILEQKVMPSMRLLQFAGRAARKTNVCAYNCSFISPSTLDDFAEIMYISMCGTGVGFSVEQKNVQNLPTVKEQTGEKYAPHSISDSKEGWCDALTLGIKTWFNGNDIDFDYSLLRPAGARLKTMGGKSSGPKPLKQLLSFTREKILAKQGLKLSTLDVHDIICKIGEIVVSGGVRRSALISLSDLNDHGLRDAKMGQFYITEPQRSLANNSAVYNHKPSTIEFLEEWIALMKSGSGERGIFNRGGLEKTLPARRLAISQGYADSFGTNPCGEIILRSKQFCNLTEVIAREDDTEETLSHKIRIATLLGTYQATLNNFPYLSEEWKNNCQEERLLGVSITGQWDCPIVRTPSMLAMLKEKSIEINKEYAQRFGINESSCITCVKPSGTVSKAFDTASGMHPRHAQYYIQRIRISSTDALFKMLRDQGIPYYPEVGQTMDTATTYVLEFPVKAPEGSVLRNDVTALQQLEHWKMVKEHYTEHNPSVTISVSDDEWIDVAHWVYSNWDIIGGLSFLPRSNHVYQLAPYEEIDEQKYNELLKKVAHIDFSKIVTYEIHDETELKRELACFAGACDIA